MEEVEGADEDDEEEVNGCRVLAWKTEDSVL
jgi:hypothetical protein